MEQPGGHAGAAAWALGQLGRTGTPAATCRLPSCCPTGRRLQRARPPTRDLPASVRAETPAAPSRAPNRTEAGERGERLRPGPGRVTGLPALIEKVQVRTDQRRTLLGAANQGGAAAATTQQLGRPPNSSSTDAIVVYTWALRLPGRKG